MCVFPVLICRWLPSSPCGSDWSWLWGGVCVSVCWAGNCNQWSKRWVIEEHCGIWSEEAVCDSTSVSYQTRLFVRGAVSGPHYHWGSSEGSGGPRQLCASPPDLSVQWGSLHHLLRQGSVLQLQHQRQAAGPDGDQRLHTGMFSTHFLSVRLDFYSNACLLIMPYRCPIVCWVKDEFLKWILLSFSLFSIIQLYTLI